MIPPFDDSGNLPPGLHPATLPEIDARFGQQSELRRVQIYSVRWMIDMASRAGVNRIVLNGSFITDTIEPNDVDCVLPFLDMKLVGQTDFDEYVNVTFATDRIGVPKGMIEVML